MQKNRKIVTAVLEKENLIVTYPGLSLDYQLLSNMVFYLIVQKLESSFEWYLSYNYRDMLTEREIIQDLQ